MWPSYFSNAGVKEKNPYVFPSLLQSFNHYSGSESFDSACQKLPILKHNINRTKICQMISYIKAGMDMSDKWDNISSNGYWERPTL